MSEEEVPEIDDQRSPTDPKRLQDEAIAAVIADKKKREAERWKPKRRKRRR